MNRVQKYDYLLIGLVAFIYFALLCAKSWSFIFVGQDSGDWLAGSMMWVNVQPYGSPLYILLGHLLNAIPISNLVIKMTVVLSVIPSAITVSFTYLIAKKLTDNRVYGLISALVLMGAAIFLSQSTIIEEYSIATMFFTIAFWFYVNGQKKLTILFLALGSAIHVIIAVISLIWLCLHLKEIKQWYKAFPIYIVVGILPYSMVFILMYLDVPRLIAGHLSLQNINAYLGSSGTIGSISWYEFLHRVPEAIGILAVSIGLGLVPIFFGLHRPFNKIIYLMISTIGFSLWLYLTDIDPTTWTFMTFCFPMIAVLVSLGLKNMKPFHSQAVAYGAIVLILINGIFLNANVLSQQYPVATDFEQAVKDLPDNSAIVVSSGGEYGLGVSYLMAQGKKVFPIYYSGKHPDKYDGLRVQFLDSITLKPIIDPNDDSQNYLNDVRYKDYCQWIAEDYGVHGVNTQQMVKDLLLQNRNVYLLSPTLIPYWQDVFQTQPMFKTLQSDKFYTNEDILNHFFVKIVGVN